MDSERIMLHIYMAITYLVPLTKKIYCKGQELRVFQEISKAFDPIDHTFLINKLQSYHGVRGL